MDMPVSKSDFKDGKKKYRLNKLILSFLGEHNDNAYNLIEIADGIGLIQDQKIETKDIPNLIWLYDTLRSLVANHKLIVRWVDSDYYFISKKV
jgi:hypothetical protein